MLVTLLNLKGPLSRAFEGALLTQVLRRNSRQYLNRWTQREKRGMQSKTTASQLLLFRIKHTVSGLAWPQEQGVCVCVSLYDHKNVALWRAVKGAVNLGGGKGRQQAKTHKHTPPALLKVSRRQIAPQDTHGTHHSVSVGCARSNKFIFFYLGLVDVSLQLPSGVFVRQAAPFHQIQGHQLHTYKPKAVSVSVWRIREKFKPMKDDCDRSKYLSIFVCALWNVKDTVHLHIVWVKRLIVHLKKKKEGFQNFTFSALKWTKKNQKKKPCASSIHICSVVRRSNPKLRVIAG